LHVVALRAIQALRAFSATAAPGRSFRLGAAKEARAFARANNRARLIQKIFSPRRRAVAAGCSLWL
jgi:hypothetical protein